MSLVHRARVLKSEVGRVHLGIYWKGSFRRVLGNTQLRFEEGSWIKIQIAHWEEKDPQQPVVTFKVVP